MPRSPYDYAVAGNCSYETFSSGSTPVDSLVESARFTETFSGVTRRKPSGFLAPTPYSFTHRTIANASGTSEIRHSIITTIGDKMTGIVGGGTGVAGRFHSSEHFGAAMPESDPQESNIANRALLSARSALKNTEVNLGVAFAERNATARLVGNTATSLWKSYKALRRGETRRAMDLLGISSARREPRGSNAPRKWLELQYGWKPLLTDVYGSCDALSKRHKDDWRVTAVGRASRREDVSFSRNGPDRFSMTAWRTCSAFCRIDAFPKNEAIISLSSLGITNPLLIGWELLPFSFVVDWFLPVGGYLESLDALLGYDVLGYSNSVLTRAGWNGVGTSGTDPSYPGFIIKNVFNENKSFVSLSRSASADVPFPKFPSFKDPRSLGHMANALSLLAVVFKP